MRVLIIFLLFLSFGCKNYVVDRFTYDELLDVFADAHTLGIVYNRQVEKDEDLKNEYFKILETKYGLNPSEFQQLVDEVIQNSKLYESIYTDLKDKMDELERKQMELGI